MLRGDGHAEPGRLPGIWNGVAGKAELLVRKQPAKKTPSLEKEAVKENIEVEEEEQEEERVAHDKDLELEHGPSSNGALMASEAFPM